MAANGHYIEAFLATVFTPSGTRKGYRNANMRVIFPGVKKIEEVREYPF